MAQCSISLLLLTCTTRIGVAVSSLQLLLQETKRPKRTLHYIRNRLTNQSTATMSSFALLKSRALTSSMQRTAGSSNSPRLMMMSQTTASGASSSHIARSLTTSVCYPSAATAISSSPFISANCHHHHHQCPISHLNSTHQQYRSYWQEVIRRNVRDRKNPNKPYKYEDPSNVVQRFQEPKRGKDGATLLSLHLWNDKHEKPWMKRKRLESLKIYNRNKQHVLDLAKYIEFVQENSTTSAGDSTDDDKGDDHENKKDKKYRKKK